MLCKICSSPTKILFNQNILNKYLVNYHQCTSCDFIQTDEPHWLPEAYESAINLSDVGYVNRNNESSYITAGLIELFFKHETKFVDFGGGYGLFVRLMRDYGYNYFLEDKFCQNLFANKFECNEIPNEKFELLTAFEVFEHLPDPMSEISKMLKYSNSIFFSTKIYPSNVLELSNWWYLGTDTGQHISLYSIKSLKIIAAKLQLNLYSDGKDFHLITPNKINKLMFKLIMKYKIAFLYFYIFKTKRISLINKDYIFLKNLDK